MLMVGDCGSRKHVARLAASQRLAGLRLVRRRAVGSELVVTLLVALAGCSDERPASTTSSPVTPTVPRPSVALRVLVVNEPELAEAIERLRGEWAERYGGSLTAEAKPWPEVAAADSLDADVIIFPSRYLGELSTRDRLRSVRSNLLEDADFDADDIFPVVRRGLIVWDDEVMAVPLGVDAPTTGESFDHRPAVTFLMRVAQSVVSADRVGVLFDPRTMRPRIAEPPFVDALKQLRNSNTAQDPSQLNAIPRVAVLGVADRLAGVTTASRNAASAFKLLAWLAGPDISSQLARAGNGTMPVRQSLASSPAWYDASLSASERRDLGRTLEKSLSSERYLIVPRIPGIDEYLATLDAAVQDALSGNADAQSALEHAAAEWEKITDTHGRETQRQAYRKHLGLNPQ